MKFIHKEGYLILIILLIILSFLNVFLYYNFHYFFVYTLSISIIIFTFILQFFKNPKRIPPNSSNKDSDILSPADGKIVIIEKVFEKEYLKKEVIQVSIFMSPLNVHVNRVPISGTLEYYKYHKGKYMVAFHPKSSELNERNTSVIKNRHGKKILMRQIAGAVARRIRYYLKEGDTVEQGEELGFIKFGSRVDLFLPLDAKIQVELEQKVSGNKDLIATI